MTSPRRSAALLIAVVGCASPAATPGNIDLDRLTAADREPGQWLALGRNFKGDRFSPLDKITAANATKLGFAWEYPARSRRGRVEHGQEATPIVVDGVLYASGPWGVVYAVDARTGQEKWRYDPEVDGSYNRKACCDVVSRGLQVWKGRVYVATLDGYLVALEAATGKEVWKVDTFTGVDRVGRAYTITGPPQVAKNVVVVGNSGAEFGVRGYVTAFDLETGAEKWRFYTVPGDPSLGPPENAAMAEAAKTWGPKTDWESGLGGTVWGEMNYDPELNLLYVGTGNSTPYAGWHRDPSRGDNLYLVSILAINPDDGRLRWHYQQVPWELWDYTATANMILADLTIDGKPRKVIMQAPKNGIFYVLDRQTGEFISGKPFVFVNWLTGFDSTGRPQINPAAIYQDRPAVIFPTQVGAHNWQPMAFNPATGLVYIPTREQGMVMENVPTYQWRPGVGNVGAGGAFGFVYDLLELDPKIYDPVIKATPGVPSLDTREALIAWDPVAQQARWRADLGTEEYAGGGVVTTAGNLVIQGSADGRLTVYRADDGTKLHELETGTGIMAAPVSYELDGEQYVAVLAGFGGARARLYPKASAGMKYQNYGRILAFKLGGTATPLPPERAKAPIPEPPVLEGSSAAVTKGGELFLAHCVTCHGARGEQRISSYPDLFQLPAATHAAFEAIVLGGQLANFGMASFADVLRREDAKAIQLYLAREQAKLRASEMQR
ncbi:MAG: PQQ-dependent dehydrogenase, methanol/ethanol family [Gemmatimonadetes bacterium]|nr:PQQ-dependent dehydrogenase, methanol/ethanol family [Gemmatimonadota bacterium]